jgi:prephenate dehydrogenase (NADP+)
MTETLTAIPPDMEGFVVGLIGMGDMGKMYARCISDAGWR